MHSLYLWAVSDPEADFGGLTMAEYIEREALLNRVKTLTNRITPIEENRDMFYHDSGWNGAIVGTRIEIGKIPAADVVSRVAFEQIMWERDQALHQLEKHGLTLGCKADVVEVKHGTWLPQIVLGQKAWDCSECKTLGSPQWNWCPICGAKMDGERRSE